MFFFEEFAYLPRLMLFFDIYTWNGFRLAVGDFWSSLFSSLTSILSRFLPISVSFSLLGIFMGFILKFYETINFHGFILVNSVFPLNCVFGVCNQTNICWIKRKRICFFVFLFFFMGFIWGNLHKWKKIQSIYTI